MELKRFEPLAETLSGLLRQSVRDVRKIEKMAGYGLAMDTWHSEDRSLQVCYVCMAGAVMACTLGAPQDASSESIFAELNAVEGYKMSAIDLMRRGDFRAAFRCVMGTALPTPEEHEALGGAMDLVSWALNGYIDHAPWEDYEKAAAILEAAGLMHLDVAEQVITECPFCKGKYGFFKTKDGKQGSAHTTPVCEKFENEEPLTFLRNARFAKGIVLPDDDEFPVTGGGHE